MGAAQPAPTVGAGSIRKMMGPVSRSNALPQAFDLALGLLNHAFNLEFWIVGQLARLALGNSGYFVNHSRHLIFVHKNTSMDLLLVC